MSFERQFLCLSVAGTFFFICLVYSELPYAFPSQPAFICSKLTIEILEQGVNYVQIKTLERRQ